jgi:hypothetical protein
MRIDTTMPGTLAAQLSAGPTASESATLERQRLFMQAMARADTAADAPARAADEQKQAREAAEELVARSLVQPLLARMRESRDAAPPFGPGEFDKTFGGLMDAEMANRLTRAGNWALIDRVTESLIARSAAKATEGEGVR